MVGNKCDLEEERVVQKEVAESFSTMNNMGFVEASAKNNDNVQIAFERISEITLKRQKEMQATSKKQMKKATRPRGQKLKKKGGQASADGNCQC